ncbi:hypothetical protein DEU56DRAFT_736319 [Suillus clintonianus]|uniref:uncharacterized protein n=1 Tax=Suillus clintonianus TaxID=1904413 RepID=UPI001B866444|nr:uncharacterized protein DEU56DRAFT_736319 [Suillus clintonianus]KAG2138353.1 hypothetical protein DEU56DRAFT_736319 [Suillus clintonianus]
MVGLTLAAKLIATEQQIEFPLSISIDNQAAIVSGERFHSGPGAYLSLKFQKLLRAVKWSNPHYDITVRWVPGHEGVHGNEEVDKAAKVAAEGLHRSSPRASLPKYLRNGPLPLSIAALKQAHRAQIQARWTRIWPSSPRFQRLQEIEPNAPNRSFLKLTAQYSKRLTSLIISLCTRHIPLNQHLHRLTKVDSPHCPHCPQTEETIHHYLFACPQYQRERHILSCALGRKSTSLPHLLAASEAIPHLARFVNATRCMKPMLGEISLPST